CLLRKQLARLQAADHGLQELEHISLQDSMELVLTEITGQPHTTPSAGVHPQLLLPHAELRTNVQIEQIRFLAGANAGMARQQALDPGGPAARAADDEKEIVARVVEVEPACAHVLGAIFSVAASNTTSRRTFQTGHTTHNGSS